MKLAIRTKRSRALLWATQGTLQELVQAENLNAGSLVRHCSKRSLSATASNVSAFLCRKFASACSVNCADQHFVVWQGYKRADHP